MILTSFLPGLGPDRFHLAPAAAAGQDRNCGKMRLFNEGAAPRLCL
jgi:hypothetical protein